MDLVCDERASDSPLVETVWRSQGELPGPFISMAETRLALVVTRYKGQSAFTVRGPSTAATSADVAEGAEYFGIQFRPGVFMPGIPPGMVRQRNELTLPEAGSRSFWLGSAAWQYPGYENADVFVERLVRQGLLLHDPIVESVLHAEPMDLSVRTLRRRFLRATGLTHGALYQIDRARYAASLLKQGASVLDTAYAAGYFDQPHMTRSLKRFIGLTPAQVGDARRTERLSLLYKQQPAWAGYNTNNEDEFGRK